MKQALLMILTLQFGFASNAQNTFEMTFGDSGVYESVSKTIDHEGHYYSLGVKIFPDNHKNMVIYKLDYSGAIVNTVEFPKSDTAYSMAFFLPKPNGNLLCFGTIKHVDNPLRARHTYVCEISPDLELVWEKMDSIVENHPHASHYLKTYILTNNNEVIIQGVVDTVQYGHNNFIFLAKYDLEGNRLGYKSFINYYDDALGSMMLNADSTGFYLFSQLTVKPAYRTWIEFDFAFNYIGSGILESGYSSFWGPITVSRLSTGNFVIASRFFDNSNNTKGLEMTLHSPDKQLLKSMVVFHDKTIRIPEKRGMGFINEAFIWVATFEDIPPGFSGIEDIRFFVFDNEINLKGTMTHKGDTRYWLSDLLATNDTACIVSGFVAEDIGTNITDNFIKKVRLEDVVTGISKQQRISSAGLEMWPVPAGETLNVKSIIDSELLIMDATGHKLSIYTIRKGYNLISLTGLAPGIYLVAIRQNEIILETHNIIKQ
ncbi:MAG: T9SS type A sorting domain-containing protein [Bacteroidales bacterium]|nr:T9SS type A sorting domain-containing protein [Bacteroidales bacterium]